MNTLHLIAVSRGVLPAQPGSTCVVCGPSPFASGREANDLLGPGFTDYDALHAPGATHECVGCCSVLGGKPGSMPMPLRMGHFAVVGGAMLRPDGAELLALILDPPADLQAIAWTATRKRHASLRCGPCSPGLLMVGAETGTIAWDVEKGRVLCAAILALRSAARQEQVLTGQYPPHVILALGSAWEPAEAIVARYRPSLALEMAVALVRRPESPTDTEIPPMPLAESERRAAELALSIGQASTLREADPIAFWATVFPRRVAAAGTRASLLDAAGWLAEKVRVNPSTMGDALTLIESMDAKQSTETLSLWRDRSLLVVAFARQISRERYQETV